jgi:cytochrome d ubiquinol oxidase subunit II
MQTAWYAIIAAMLAVYVVLDGFDFGVGILHRIVARTDQERRTVLAAIGPVWDGNEVWLIASGGLLFMAFPKVYATAFSGFYLALMVVLWLLILRGVAIEFRRHQENPLWREFWDTVFSLASAALAVVFGTALGNLVRGVPLGKDGLAGMPLFTDLRPGRAAGLFDWYTGLVGVFALAALAGHGALYLAWKTAGAVHDRSLQFSWRAWWAVLALWIVVNFATAWVRPEALSSLVVRPWNLAFVILSAGGMFGVLWFPARGQEFAAFLSSCAFLVGMVVTAFAANYPYWLWSTLGASYSLTATNAAAEGYALRVGLAWWFLGIALVAAYFTCLFRSTRGKVSPDGGAGY